MKQGYWMLNPIEVKSVLLFPFRGEREFGKQKYKIAQCQSREITLWKYVDIVRIPFILMTIDMSSSSRIEKLPSSYTYYSPEWKVLHQKKNKKQNKKQKRQTFIFFIWSISQNCVHSTYATTLFQVGKFAKIVLRVLVFLTPRDRAPFFLVLSRLFISSKCFMIRN